MFTGIIEAVGHVRGWIGPATLEIKAPSFSKALKIGGSLSVNGACLTVVKKTGSAIFFNVVRETKTRTMLGDLVAGDTVNLERPLKLGKRVEGHWVLGHVDGVGRVRKVIKKQNEKSFLISFPGRLRPYFLEKGSVAVNGASLTLGKVARNAFWIHCIPHTLRATNFQGARVGTKVNLEADILAKLVLTRRRRPV